MKAPAWLSIFIISCLRYSNGESIEQAARKAVDEAAKNIPIAPTSETDKKLKDLGGSKQPSISSDTLQSGSTRKANLFGRTQPRSNDAVLASRGAQLAETAAAILQNKSFPLNLNLEKAVSSAVQQDQALRYTTLPSKFVCGDDKYRRPDGRCNNKLYPFIGAAGTPQSRFVSPEYGDSWNLGIFPRVKGKNGDLLPGPRDISNAIFKSPTGQSPRSPKFNIALTHFGQFIDHDIIATPIFADIDGSDLHCCNGNLKVFRPECFPFDTPPGDFKYTCMNFVRSLPASTFPWLPAPRQQLNVITSWLDLSSVYGSSKAELNLLRGNKGDLKEGQNGLLPNEPTGGETCVKSGSKNPCFLAGDHRNSEVPLLTVWHTVFMREHNRIARELRTKYGWGNEKTFQEARKILTGVYQHVVYNEFIPALLGRTFSSVIGLISRPLGLINLYSPYLDGSTRNAFGAAAFRFGHSLVGNFVGGSNVAKKEKLQNTFFETGTIRDQNDYGPSGIGKWMSENYGRQMDRYFSDQLRNHLFETDPGEGLDLGALNIQRGRDHGLPGYNKFREFCGLYPAKFFSNTPGGLIDHSIDVVNALKNIYKNVDDIDLYVGAISERPKSSDTILGPTFRCLIAVQFLNYKYGDRFFYENDFKQTGFTCDQVDDIKKQTLAGIYCRNLQLDTIQPQLFLNPDNTEEPISKVNCTMLPDLSFDLYK